MKNAEELVSILKDKHLTLGSVESMSGGAFAKAITDVPGSSAVFVGSLVTYQAALKCSLLGIEPELISTYDVVSKEVAFEMARLGQEKLNVDICVSITGNAGPTCETGKAGVGVFYIGVAYKNIDVYEYCFEGSRKEIREQAVEMMIKKISELSK